MSMMMESDHWIETYDTVQEWGTWWSPAQELLCEVVGAEEARFLAPESGEVDGLPGPGAASAKAMGPHGDRACSHTSRKGDDIADQPAGSAAAKVEIMHTCGQTHVLELCLQKGYYRTCGRGIVPVARWHSELIRMRVSHLHNVRTIGFLCEAHHDSAFHVAAISVERVTVAVLAVAVRPHGQICTLLQTR
eukprot:CAMPEP_0180832624 /NCGR_PEP_ID=MMETSP1038_2-20121128/76934_1 /TAXON_ID=632150 /ORGANISM="Azadinium spinosum, Strain 3D9" /LENGTH=190 /DNA_ID=CAMNT_0022875827 /DNA_START=481 /DNA_END=1056 /DNA_ORIENTATION=+